MPDSRAISSESFVVYWLGGEAHCVRASCVAKVLRVPLRGNRDEPLRQISYEGMTVDLVDLREQLSVEGGGQGQHVLLVKGSKGLLGLIVDRVDAVLPLNAQDFAPPSKLLKGLDHLVGIATYGESTMMVTDLSILVERITAEDPGERDEEEHPGSR